MSASSEAPARVHDGAVPRARSGGGAPLAAALAVALTVTGGGRREARGAGFDLDFFKPTSPATGVFHEENGLTVAEGQLDVSVAGGYSHRPLVQADQRNLAISRAVVRDRLTSFLLVSFGLNERLDVGFRLAAVARQVGDVDVEIADDAGIPQRPRTPALGDLELLLRVALVRVDAPDHRFRLTLLAPVGLPTGETEALAGSGEFSFRPRLIAGWHVADLALSASVGYTHVAPVEIPYSALIVGTAVSTGVGVSYALFPQSVWLQAEVTALMGLDLSKTATGTGLAQIMVGPRLRLPGELIVQAGVGTGLTRTAGSPSRAAMVAISHCWGGP